MSWRRLARTNVREHAIIYLFASISNIFLSTPQYLAVYSAVASSLPVDPGTASLIGSYGNGLGIALELFYTSLIFQGILAVLVVTLASSLLAGSSWRWVYRSAGSVISVFLGYWLGAKFLRILEWISTLQNNRIDVSSTYTGLFWFGLGATICYVAMILVVRRSYGRLVETNMTIVPLDISAK